MECTYTGKSMAILKFVHIELLLHISVLYPNPSLYTKTVKCVYSIVFHYTMANIIVNENSFTKYNGNDIDID